MNHQKWIVVVARVGYAAKCVVYSVLGILIVLVAFNAASTANISKKSVFQEILFTPFGTVSLTAVVIGFACYVVWRATQGIINPDNLDMKKASDLVLRSFYFFSAIAYASATYVAFKVLIGSPDDQQNTKEQIGQSILQHTWGVILVAILSVLIIIFSGIQFKHAFKTDFMDKFVSSISHTEKKLIMLFGKVGFASRGIVYALVGCFYMNASLTSDSDKAGGLSKAISTLLQQPFGPWLVGALGLGMICFGLFCGFEGRYRKT